MVGPRGGTRPTREIQRTRQGTGRQWVEHCVVVPHDHVLRADSIVTLLVQALDKEVNVRLDDGLLVADAALAKAMREGTTQRSMLFTFSVDNVLRRAGYGAVVVLVVGHLGGLMAHCRVCQMDCNSRLGPRG